MTPEKILEKTRLLFTDLSPTKQWVTSVPGQKVTVHMDWEFYEFQKVAELAAELMNRIESIGWDRELYTVVRVERFCSEFWQITFEVTWDVPYAHAGALATEFRAIID